MMARPIMIQGTMSNAGKSLLAAGLCRIFAQDGYRVAPFKSQNMALNSYITADGLEMGRAQAVQAEAAGIEPSADMNPILLKPTTDVGSQVIVNGTSIGNMRARDYFAYKRRLIPEILAAYERLSKEYDIIVIEGAGSPAEINLKKDDIVNMGLADMVDAPVLLAGDIDRGGVFAQLYGTVALLEQRERDRIGGLIVNKFRGDPSILEPGIRQLEQLCGLPVVGVVPYMDVDIEDEDSLSGKLSCGEKGLVDLAVIHFPRISNFTDLDVFYGISGVSVRYVTKVSELGTPDMVILPGTKNTISDLLWMRQNGLEGAVLKLAARQVPVWGICGGYQMMGEEISDKEGVESGQCRRIRGMGLLPLETDFEEEKIRTRSEGAFGELDGLLAALSGKCISGYEIHMGRTRIACQEGPAGTARRTRGRKEPEICRPMCYLLKGNTKQAQADGWNRGNCYGAYVHGIFDAPGIAHTIAEVLANKKGITLDADSGENYSAYRDRQYDRLAEGLRRSLDMKRIYEIMGLEEPGQNGPERGIKAKGETNLENRNSTDENVTDRKTIQPDTAHIQLEEVLPAEIECRSFEIIKEELAAMGKVLDPAQDLVVRRAIHTTADFDYADQLVFSEGAVEAGKEALRRGAVIITDTNMAWSGINKKKLRALGGEAVCFMADEDVASQAAAAGSTRAVASMDKAARLCSDMAPPPCIFAIGNAPTALIRLYELIRDGKIRPALIIGAPVGFVNVVQSKELILTLPDTPYIVARGRKGGSNVAAALCNALLYQTKQ